MLLNCKLINASAEFKKEEKKRERKKKEKRKEKERKEKTKGIIKRNCYISKTEVRHEYEVSTYKVNNMPLV